MRPAPNPAALEMRTPLNIVLGGVTAALLFASGCGSDPFAVRWTESPQEATIYSLDRPEPHLRSAFNLSARRAVRLEGADARGRWDFALERRDGRLYLVPPGAMGVRGSQAAISPVAGVPWEDVREAPSDTARFVSRAPVLLEAGTIYVVRTHEQLGSFGRTCVFYGKVEPLDIDLERGALTFLNDVSPDCNNRRLVPRGS